MSTSANKPEPSAPAAVEAEHELLGVVRAMSAAAPGVVQSIILVTDVLDGQVSGVVLDATEPGGGYVAEQELAPGVAYIVLGVGKLGVGKLPPGIRVLTTEANPHD